MFFLQTTNSSSVSLVLFLGTLGMVVLMVSLIIFIILHQRRVLKFQNKINQMEQEQQKILLNASIKLQEEERQRLLNRKAPFSLRLKEADQCAPRNDNAWGAAAPIAVKTSPSTPSPAAPQSR